MARRSPSLAFIAIGGLLAAVLSVGVGSITTTNVAAADSPSLALDVTPDVGLVSSVGQVVHYTFVLTNTGDTNESGLEVDPEFQAPAGPSPSAICPGGSLSVGESLTCTASYTVTQADLDQGNIETKTFAQAFTTDGFVGAETKLTNILTETDPALSVTNSATPLTVSAAGQTVNYEYHATNTGTATLSALAPVASDGETVVCPVGALAVGATDICTSSHVVTQAEIDAGVVNNSVTAFAKTTHAVTVASLAAPTTVDVVESPSVNLSTAPDTVAATAGQSIGYSFGVVNTGNVTLHGLTVVVGAFSGSGTLSAVVCPSMPVAPGASTTCTASYTATQTDIDSGAITTLAQATMTDPGGADISSPESSSTVATNPTATLGLDVSADHTKLDAIGELLTYTFAVTNTGNVTIVHPSVTVTSFSGTGTLSAITCPTDVAPGTLAPAAGENCTATYSVTKADFHAKALSITATVGGTPAGAGVPIASDPSTSRVATALPTPRITIAGLAFTGTDPLWLGLTATGLLLLGIVTAWGAILYRRRA